MTFILSCVTHDAVFQVSDRRLTSFAPPHEPIDEEANKATLHDGNLVLGYTGISLVDGQRADRWLANTLAKHCSNSIDQTLAGLREEATAAFARMKIDRRYKRHAFHGIGWFNTEKDPYLRPGIITVTNFFDRPTKRWLSVAKDEFESSLWGLSGFEGLHGPRIQRHQFYVTSVGTQPSPAEQATIFSVLRSCAHRDRGRSRVMLQAMVMATRWLSTRYEPNSPIGRNLLAVALPRRAVERQLATGGIATISSGPEDEAATFLSVPEFQRAEHYGPNFVVRGCAMVDFRAGPL